MKIKDINKDERKQLRIVKKIQAGYFGEMHGKLHGILQTRRHGQTLERNHGRNHSG